MYYRRGRQPPRLYRGAMKTLTHNQCLAKLAEIEELEFGWDGDSAEPIKKEVLARVRDWLGTRSSDNGKHFPSVISPSPDGGVVAAWHNNVTVFLECWFEPEGGPIEWMSSTTLGFQHWTGDE